MRDTAAAAAGPSSDEEDSEEEVDDEDDSELDDELDDSEDEEDKPLPGERSTRLQEQQLLQATGTPPPPGHLK
jgi:hypothetical protein